MGIRESQRDLQLPSFPFAFRALVICNPVDQLLTPALSLPPSQPPWAASFLPSRVAEFASRARLKKPTPSISPLRAFATQNSCRNPALCCERSLVHRGSLPQGSLVQASLRVSSSDACLHVTCRQHHRHSPRWLSRTASA